MSAAEIRNIKKIVLAYSGGLDTSVILKWLQDTYKCEVVTFTADLGQGEELEPVRSKAEMLGVNEVFVDDLREEFVKNFVFPMLRGNALYEGMYLLGTAIARPLIAKRQIEIAKQVGADAVAHGATGKGNDQVRFELNAYALSPNIKIIAPWREWELGSRDSLIAYAHQHGLTVEDRFSHSMDANLLHISYEGGELEDPWVTPAESIWRWTASVKEAPDEAEIIELAFEHGDPVAINDQRFKPGAMMERLNDLGARHGIGRTDLVENRYVGMKSRGCYETPGGTILLKAHRAIESITLDREVAHLKDALMPRYAELIYNGYWFAPERTLMQEMIDQSQVHVSGVVKLELYKGNVSILGRRSENSLYDETIATFEDDAGAYQQRDAEGFIKLNALRMRVAASKGRRQSSE